MRERVRQLVTETKPFMLIGSPPCTMFCLLQNLSRNKRDPKVFAKKMAEAEKHIRFCLELYEMQRSAGRCFLHEHPNTATSWQMPEMIAFAAKPDIETTVCDMCAYGMQVQDEHGEAYARKNTKLMSNAPEVLKRLGKRCPNRPVPVAAEAMRAATRFGPAGQSPVASAGRL